jgi:two-component system sensor histidine kinase UhpB
LPFDRDVSPLGPIVQGLLAIPLTAKLLIANGAIVAAVALAVSWLTRASAEAYPGGPPSGSLALLVLAATALSLLANALVVRSALAPLRELERVAAAVERGDFGARARLGPVRDRQTGRVTLLTNRILDAHQADRAALASLSAREMAAREEERRVVAAELRDQVGQSCAALAVGIQSLVRGIEGPEVDRAALKVRAQGLIELTRAAYDLVQGRAQGLRPSALDDLGLVPALRSAAKRWSEQHGRPVELWAEGLAPGPGAPAGIVLYRVAEAAVASAAGAVGATRVVLRLRADAESVELAVSDDGRGFEVGPADLVAMRERLALVGGHLKIASAPGRSTTLQARVPAAGTTAGRAASVGTG